MKSVVYDRNIVTYIIPAIARWIKPTKRSSQLNVVSRKAANPAVTPTSPRMTTTNKSRRREENNGEIKMRARWKALKEEAEDRVTEEEEEEEEEREVMENRMPEVSGIRGLRNLPTTHLAVTAAEVHPPT